MTCHYARIAQDRSTGRWQLRKALDGSKDQSYVLYMLSQKQLSHLRFPLGELSKTDARAIAEKAGLVTASKHESQDICFIPDGDYGAFLEHWTGRCDPEGEILNLEGRVIGRHHGAIRYTIGQRRGLGVAAEQPLYVVAKDMEKHSVIVKDGKIVGRGHNRVVLNNDPTCHGEVSALRDAGQKLGTFDMSGCELYTTGEPCPMCLCACLWANIDKVYYGCTIEDNEIIGFRDEDFDELFGGREAFSDYLVCLDREACLELFDAYLNMERTNY